MTADKVKCRMKMTDAHMMQVIVDPELTCCNYRKMKVIGSFFYLLLTDGSADGKCRTCSYNNAVMSAVVKKVKELEEII